VVGFGGGCIYGERGNYTRNVDILGNRFADPMTLEKAKKIVSQTAYHDPSDEYGDEEGMVVMKIFELVEVTPGP
jgi:hypothetical protein